MERVSENCLLYNGTYCMKEWNNLDERYKVPERDKKDPADTCDDCEVFESEEG